MENEVSNPTADESFSFKKITGAEDGNYYKAFVSEIEKSGSMNDAVKIANKTLNEFREAYDNSYFKKGQAGSTDEEIFNYIAQARKENRGAKGVACMEAHKSVSGAMKDAGYNVGVFQVSVIESGRHSPFICNDGTNNYVAVDWDNRYEYKDMPSVLSAIRHSIKDASYNINTGIDRIFSNDGKTAYNDENLPGTDFGKNGKKVMQKPIDVFTDDTTPLDNNISVGIGCKGTATLFRETTRSLELNYSHDEGKDPTYGDYNTNSVIADYQAKTPIGKNGANAALYGKYEFSKVKTDNLVIKKQYDTWTDFLEKKQDFNVHSFNLGAQLAGKKHKLAGIESQSFVNAEYGGYVISDKPEVEYRKLYSISLDRDISVENNYINTAIGTKIQLGDEDSNYRAS